MRPPRPPRSFEPIWAIGEKYPDEPMALGYNKERGFFEPRTNKDAEPIIGRILAWQYRCKDRVEDDEAYEAVIELARDELATSVGT